ncbi:putative reverse transcriptase domain-containing protein, partial [Tanacetum coccineum]
MPSYFHKKFRWGTVFVSGHRSFIEPETGLRMKRTNRRTRVPIGIYPCHIKEKMTMNEFPGKFGGHKLTSDKEVEENKGLKEVWEKMEYVISDSDSGLESTAKSENDFKALLVEEFCPSNEMEKLENEFWNHTVPTTIQSAILTAEILTDEAVCCGTLTKGNDKRKKMEESSKKGSTWKDNKRSKTGSGFVATVPSRNDNVNTYLKCAKACYECGSLDHLRYDCPKCKQATRQARNPLALEGNKNTRNNGNQARGKAFNGNAVEALQDPKVVTGTFSLNNQFATVLFDSGVDFSFISIKFAPL